MIPRLHQTFCSSAANSASKAFHTSGPFGCSMAALASSSEHARSRQPPDLCREPGELICHQEWT